jgi:hypothetical protein
MSPVILYVLRPCSLLNVTGQRKIQTSSRFLMVAYRNYVDLTLLVSYAVRNLTLKLRHTVIGHSVYTSEFMHRQN